MHDLPPSKDAGISRRRFLRNGGALCLLPLAGVALPARASLGRSASRRLSFEHTHTGERPAAPALERRGRAQPAPAGPGHRRSPLGIRHAAIGRAGARPATWRRGLLRLVRLRACRHGTRPLLVKSAVFMPAPVTITLPDGSQRQFDGPVSVDEVAASIGAGLRKAALAGRVDGKVVDTSFVIDHDAQLSIITDKDPAGLGVIRHSTAHLLAQAVKQLYPEAQVTIGPVIEDGFFYDFAYSRAFTPEDLAKIEQRMTELAKADLPVKRRELSRDAAVKHFLDQGEKYKAEIIGSIPAGEPIGLYGQGDWEDLCRGPHVPSTGKLKAFKLMKVAGAYWRGDSRNEMLQRIYGTAWTNDKD